ncbi:MAG: DUF1361 domain-containing protein [Bacteroidetes bacterium]|nr:MAG: DUF1361 domain-containing protein [Bacteroidota bacterium]
MRPLTTPSNFIKIRHMSVRLFRHRFAACAALVLLLWFARYVATGSPRYFFLVWNLFLAATPLIIAVLAKRYRLQGPLLVAASVVWLLFFPNAPYIITDLYHLDHLAPVAPQLWYDPLMVFVAAYTGLKMGFVSLGIMEQLWRPLLRPARQTPLTPWLHTLALGAVFLATGFGLYAGRVLRWNSWDVVSQPVALIKSVGQQLFFPLQHQQAWQFTCLYAGVLMVLYWFSGLKMGLRLRT